MFTTHDWRNKQESEMKKDDVIAILEDIRDYADKGADSASYGGCNAYCDIVDYVNKKIDEIIGG